MDNIVLMTAPGRVYLAVSHKAVRDSSVLSSHLVIEMMFVKVAVMVLLSLGDVWWWGRMRSLGAISG